MIVAGTYPPIHIDLGSNEPGDTPYKLQRFLKESGLTLQQICDRMKADYDEKLTPSALSHSISRGSIRLQRALQILAICGVTQIEIKSS